MEIDGGGRGMKRKQMIGFLITAILITLVGAGCGKNAPQQEETQSTIPVMVQKVERKSLQQGERYVGKTKAEQDVMILPKIQGASKVEAIYVQEGASVKAGQMLVKLDDTDMVDSVRRAEASYQQALQGLQQAKEGRETQLITAKRSYEDAKIALERSKALYEAQAISKSELEQAEAGFTRAEVGLQQAESNTSIASAEAGVQQAKVAVEQAQHAVSETKVTAPFAGQVADIMIEQGDMVSAQTPVAQVVNLDKVVVQLNISESSLKDFKKGNKTEVTIPSIEKTVQGTVSFVAPAANAQTMTFPVEIEVANKEQLIKPGMLAELVITKGTTEEQIVVPTQAVLGIGDDTYVFVMKDGKAVKTPIKVKEMTTNETTISSGLTEQEQVIVKGQHGLVDGDTVEVIAGEGTSS